MNPPLIHAAINKFRRARPSARGRCSQGEVMKSCNVEHRGTLCRCTLPVNHKNRHTYQYGTNGPVRWRLTRAERRQRKECEAAQEGKLHLIEDLRAEVPRRKETP